MNNEFSNLKNEELNEELNEEVNEKVNEEVNEEVNEIVETKPIFLGRVICNRLNVRKEPKLEADIVCKINLGDRVEIDSDFYNDDFFKVTTEFGLEGYCKKDFIEEW